ncbi:MAG: response regulator [Candidatus Latescibacteria bacterium]|nr:response regulator [Candidatus Latescibacterota bacterium]
MALQCAEQMKVDLGYGMSCPYRAQEWRKRTEHMASILICDEDPLFTLSLRRQLMDDGYRVEVTERAGEAIRHILSEQVDVVVLGIRTVGMSGLEALPIVNQIDPSLPVILVADDERLETEQAARRSKIFYYLVKPVDLRELRDAVRQAVSHAVGHEQGDHT